MTKQQVQTLFPEAAEASAAAQLPPVPGLRLWPGYITVAEEAAMLTAVDRAAWDTSLKRRVQHYGWQYDYRARAVRPAQYLGPLPSWAQGLAQRLYTAGCFPARPDQLIVNEYQPGQGIALHTDCEPCFTDCIVSLSLAAPVQMQLAPREAPRQRHTLELPRRSLLILQDTARYNWLHGIPARKTDPVAAGRRPRQRRVSLTFRRVDRTML